MKTFSLSMVLALVGCVTFSLPARAGLGETPQECARRYGAPVPATAKALPGGIGKATEYLSGGFRIFVIFAKGRAASVRYAELDGKALTAGDMQAMMAENGDGSSWSEPVASKLTDGSAATTYRCGKRTLATYYLDKETGLCCFFFVRAVADLSN